MPRQKQDTPCGSRDGPGSRPASVALPDRGRRVRKRTDVGAEHVYLVPGFFGFANLGELRYFAHVREFLRAACDRLAVPVVIHHVATHPTASLRRRALRVLDVVAGTVPPRGANVHLVGHSSGWLDVRLLVSP